MAEAAAEIHPPIIVGGAFPYAAQRAIRYGNGWIPRAGRLEHNGVGVAIRKSHDMATPAGRDPASLPIGIFRVPDDPRSCGSARNWGRPRRVQPAGRAG